MVKIRGINIYPQALAPLLGEVDEFLGEYICRVRRDASGRDEFTVLAEVSNVDAEGLAQKFESLLHQRLGLKMPVELAAAGELKTLTQIEQRQKPIRLLDERGLDGG